METSVCLKISYRNSNLVNYEKCEIEFKNPKLVIQISNCFNEDGINEAKILADTLKFTEIENYFEYENNINVKFDFENGYLNIKGVNIGLTENENQLLKEYYS